MHGGERPQRLGVLAVIVVELDARVQRQVILHAKLDIDRAGNAPGPDRRRHPPVGQPVKIGQIVLHLVEVGHVAFAQRRRLLAHHAGQVILRAGDAQPTDLGLGHVQADDAGPRRLPRDLHDHRLIAARLIGVLQRRARLFHVVDRAAGAEKGIDRGFDREFVEQRIAIDVVGVDPEGRGRCGRRLRRGSGVGRSRRWRRSRCPGPRRRLGFGGRRGILGKSRRCRAQRGQHREQHAREASDRCRHEHHCPQ